MHIFDTRRFVRVLVPVITCSLVTAVAGLTTATADTRESRVDALGEAAQAVAPAGSTLAAVSDRSAPVRLRTGAVKAGPVLLPSTSDADLVVSDSGIEISLPSQVEDTDAAISSDGLVTYEAAVATRPSAVVAATDNSASVQIVIPSAKAGRKYAYRLNGALPHLEDDGSITLYAEAGPRTTKTIVGTVATPWAVDAHGNPVDTHFEVRGAVLTQVVSFDADTAFPVIADPDFIFFAKCTAAVVLFAAENAVAVAKFWRVFKSVKALTQLFKGLKGMKTSTKFKYVANRLGTEVSKLSGLNDLFQRCTP